MTDSIKAFKFLRDTGSYRPKDAFIVRIPGEITGRDQLLNILYKVLILPGYFGFNWDALFDCLRDFHWLEQKLIVIAHEDLPALDEEELKIYLEILADSVFDWKPGEGHELEVVLPEAAQDKVISLLCS